MPFAAWLGDDIAAFGDPATGVVSIEVEVKFGPAAGASANDNAAAAAAAETATGKSASAAAAAADGWSVRVEALSPDDGAVVLASGSAPVPTDGAAHTAVQLTMPEGFRAWSPDSPAL